MAYTYLTLGSWERDIGASNVKRAGAENRKEKILSLSFFPPIVFDNSNDESFLIVFVLKYK